MKACKTAALRKGHGEKTIRNARIPAHGNFLAFHAAQAQMAQSAGIRDGLIKPASAQAAPAGTNLDRKSETPGYPPMETFWLSMRPRRRWRRAQGSGMG